MTYPTKYVFDYCDVPLFTAGISKRGGKEENAAALHS